MRKMTDVVAAILIAGARSNNSTIAGISTDGAISTAAVTLIVEAIGIAGASTASTIEAGARLRVQVFRRGFAPGLLFAKSSSIVDGDGSSFAL